MTTEEKFQAAVNIIRSLPKDGPYQPSHDMMLKFYGLYKQAMEGPCTDPKPAFYEMVKGYKWQAWSSLGSMTKIEAKKCYVEELKKIIETMAYTENVANFIDTLGPFYEYVDIPGKKKLNNNTAKGPPSRSDLSDSGNEVTDSSGNSSPVPNGVHFEGHVDTAAPQPLQNDVKEAVEEEASQGEEEEEEEGEEEEEEEEEEDLQVGGPDSQVTAAAAAAAAAHKVFSDSDSDEEYSEPAEFVPHLSLHPRPSTPPLHHHHHHHHSSTFSSTFKTTQQLNANSTDQEEPNSLPHPTDLQGGAITHGGGDKSHPGGLQMTPGRTMQGYGQSAGRSNLPLPFTSPSHPSQSLWGVGGGAGRGGGGGRRGGGSKGPSSVEEDVSAQLVVVLRRLQTDMESVLHRLNTLETLTLTQHHVVCRQCQGNSISTTSSTPNSSGHSWWPFPELSPRSTFFLLLWPIFLHVGFRLLPLIRCRRKQS